MQHATDGSRARLAREWFTWAQKSLTRSESLFGTIAYKDEAAYHLQSAITCALRSLLSSQDDYPLTSRLLSDNFWLTDDLIDLLGECTSRFPSLSDYGSGIAALVRSRTWPNDWRPPYTDVSKPRPELISDAEKAKLQLGRDVIESVRVQLPEVSS